MIAFLIVSCQDDRIQFPKVQSDKTSINFTSEFTGENIRLFSSTALVLRWAVTHKPEWLDISRESGEIGDGPIRVYAQISTLLPQTLSDNIVIRTSTGELIIPVTLTITISTAVQMAPSYLFLTPSENSKQVTLKNLSNQPAPWRLEPLGSYLSFSPSTGTIPAGGTSTVTVTVNRSGLASNTYVDKLALFVSEVKTLEYPVTFVNYINDMWEMTGNITDAEYDRVGDNLIVLIDTKLYKLKPESRSMSSVDLGSYGRCVSVSEDGQYAVVGAGAIVYKVDLSSMQVVKSYNTLSWAGDIVTANNWVYMFPGTFGWDTVRCINLADGTQKGATGKALYGYSKGKRHPSLDYIYTADNGITPNDAQKLDIQGGRADFLYDSPYQGEHEFDGDLWIADDGARMFTRGGDVFKLSSDQTSDMIYDTKFESPIQTLDHNTAANRVAAVYFNFNQQTPAHEVSIYSGDLSSKLSTKELPSFLINNGDDYQFIPAEGYYGFFNASGTKFFVCVRTQLNYYAFKWGITIIDIN